MKKTFACLLAFILLINSFSVVFASSTVEAKPGIGCFSFLDSENKKNTLLVSVEDKYAVQTEHYIDDVLVYRVTVTKLIPDESSERSDIVSIQIENILNDRIDRYTDYISHYIQDYETIAEQVNNRSYSYSGKINYNTYYDEFGVSHSDKLSIYQETGSTTTYNKNVSGSPMSLLSLIVSIVHTALSSVYSPLGDYASPLVNAIINDQGLTVSGGVIQEAFSQNYQILFTSVNVKARDVSTSRERIYNAGKYRVKLPNGSYISPYKYEGYLPWNSSSVAYYLFCDFWSYSYPGVSSYSN